MQKRAEVETIAARAIPESRSVAAKGQKPIGAKAGWRWRETQIRFRNPVFALREDTVELADGKCLKFAYMERTDAVIVVPVTPEGEIVLINQYRYSVDAWCLEVPAGGTHDKPNESFGEVARAELREEVGGSCATLTHVDYLHSASSLTDEKCHVYLAEGVRLSHPPHEESSETIEVRLLPVRETLALVHAGKMKDGQCALAILLCEPLLRERGYFGS